MTIYIYTKSLKISVVQVYIPMTNGMELEIEGFYVSIEKTLEQVPKKDIADILGDSVQMLAIKQQEVSLAALDLVRGMMQAIVWHNFDMKIIFLSLIPGSNSLSFWTHQINCSVIRLPSH